MAGSGSKECVLISVTLNYNSHSEMQGGHLSCDHLWCTTLWLHAWLIIHLVFRGAGHGNLPRDGLISHLTWRIMM